MNVTVVSIEPTQDSRIFEVKVLIGQDLHKFPITVKLDRIGEREMQILKSDDNYRNIFQFNLKLDREISKLVFLVYNKEIVELPAVIGNFYEGEILSVKLPANI
ncbi:hypothetical protein [Limnofasciculus baicalensis]|uniref:Uncharacterized protein n=1 Tax=Limnofasciculus baicalensis BBK-W-15 TaxID=2699891 RepID=A0AAE3GRG9_9CYAN|nr:hypothetical protein [Limnofasciculus baicalensis]MCP2728508.1 hypothetical protein [Limnofasciculus baicalensis BBK-W-15]